MRKVVCIKSNGVNSRRVKIVVGRVYNVILETKIVERKIDIDNVCTEYNYYLIESEDRQRQCYFKSDYFFVDLKDWRKQKILKIIENNRE